MRLNRLFGTLAAAVVAISGLTLAAPAEAAVPATGAENVAFSKSLKVEDRIFYPRAKDGWKDYVYISTRGNYVLSRLTIQNAKGRTIRDMRYNGDNPTWNGRLANGNFAPLGEYRAVITGLFDEYSPNGDMIFKQATTSRKVVVKSDFTRHRVWKYRAASNPTTRKRSGSGYLHNGPNGTLIMDSWGGKLQANYRFRIPKDTTGIRCEVYRSRHNDVPSGRYVVTGRRANKTTFLVTVKVTGWRGFKIEGIDLNYVARARR